MNYVHHRHTSKVAYFVSLPCSFAVLFSRNFMSTVLVQALSSGILFNSAIIDEPLVKM